MIGYADKDFCIILYVFQWALISGFFSVKQIRIFDSPHWFMELAHISGFCSAKQIIIFDSSSMAHGANAYLCFL